MKRLLLYCHAGKQIAADADGKGQGFWELYEMADKQEVSCLLLLHAASADAMYLPSTEFQNKELGRGCWQRLCRLQLVLLIFCHDIIPILLKRLSGVGQTS